MKINTPGSMIDRLSDSKLLLNEFQLVQYLHWNLILDVLPSTKRVNSNRVLNTSTVAWVMS